MIIFLLFVPLIPAKKSLKRDNNRKNKHNLFYLIIGQPQGNIVRTPRTIAQQKQKQAQFMYIYSQLSKHFYQRCDYQISNMFVQGGREDYYFWEGWGKQINEESRTCKRMSYCVLNACAFDKTLLAYLTAQVANSLYIYTYMQRQINFKVGIVTNLKLLYIFHEKMKSICNTKLKYLKTI